MTQTIISLTVFTLLGLLISFISIRRYLKFRNYQDDSKLRKKQIISSVLGLVMSIPVTLYFIYIILTLITNS